MNDSDPDSPAGPVAGADSGANPGTDPGTLQFRPAARGDLERIVELLADDAIGAARESFELPLPACYTEAFAAIDADPNNLLLVACMHERVVGVAQMTFIPNLSHRGAWRALVEGVRVDGKARSSGIGRRLFEHAIALAADRGCALVQLTSDKRRASALRFYESLGFSASHEGFKLALPRREEEPDASAGP